VKTRENTLENPKSSRVVMTTLEKILRNDNTVREKQEIKLMMKNRKKMIFHFHFHFFIAIFHLE
jgi:hypothetical protein